MHLLVKLVRAAILAGSVAACARTTVLRERIVLLPNTADRALGELFLDAHYVVAGTLVKVEDAWLYEPLGGWLMRALYGVTAPKAYEATIAVDSVLKGGRQPKRLHVVFFAPPGNLTPQVGTNAVWLAHQRQLWRLAQRSQYGTPFDIGLAFDSDDDVRPLGDWPRLHAIARALEPPSDQ
jgi:hypothetical protein